MGSAAWEDSPRIDHPAPKRSTDALHIDFGGQFPSIIEFNSLSLSFAINHGRTRSFTSAVRFLPPDTTKLLVRRFKFLVGARVMCIPVTSDDVQLGFNLLGQFLENHEPKKNFRNTWNDILILGSAINRAATLITQDTLLSRFAGDAYGAKRQSTGADLTLQFPSKPPQRKASQSESKGYVNNSWRVYEARKRAGDHA